MAIWFGYERTMTGNWQPVCYHGDKPGKGKELVGLVEVPADCIDTDGSPNFGALQKRFPLSGEDTE
ncbi:MAG: hypothetical protein LCH99_15590 [Proteobacteria bacterium]|nr:hypothetical protein [Pseudomonadota bacterium]